MIKAEVHDGGLARALHESSTRIRAGVELAEGAFAKDVASQARKRARSLGSVHRHTSSGIQAVRSKIMLDTGRQPALLGATFGGGGRSSTRQFPPFKEGGYTLYPVLRQEERKLDTLISQMIDKVL